ncbi:site-specific DNA-methyltransferase [Acetobacterium bakii]|uniref:site-specific DNA-methyltransferase n=1 Tax=Acetobacterium bakii TaxID=52689 RepID=UPI000682A1A2|nr:site-specific DNA-methyltransferase [Acetobacterium bakii]
MSKSINDTIELIWENKEKYFLGISDEGSSKWGKISELSSTQVFLRDKNGNNGSLVEKLPLNNNILFKGDNLDVLLKLNKSHQNSVKCIYIDPPFNTGKIFDHYSDALDTSDWLSMMKIRLELMRNLLTEDGSLFVHIDDDEMPYLKVLLDEVFNEGKNVIQKNRQDRHHIATIIWQKKYSPQNDAKFFSDVHDFVLVFAKNPKKFKLNNLERTEEQLKRYKNPDNDYRGKWTSSDLTVKTPSEKNIYPIELPSGRIVNPAKSRSWGVTKEKFEELVSDKRIWFGTSGNAMPRMKKFLSEVKAGVTPKTIWLAEEVGDNSEAKKELKAVLESSDIVFTTPKPERLLHRIIALASDENDLILDAFLGSGTTCAVAHKMNRRWIGIENGEQIDSIVVPRIEKIIQGEDLGGVTDLVGWKNGGEYKYFEVK